MNPVPSNSSSQTSLKTGNTTIVKNQKQIIFKTEFNSGKVNSNKILERVKTARDRDSIKNK